MSTFTTKALADGQLANSKGTVYTCPASTTAYIKSITVYNSNSTSETVTLWLNRTGTSRVVFKATLTTGDYGEALDSVLVLEAGDIIQGQATTASMVDYTISVVEET